MNEKYRVYDDRDNSTVFEGTKLQCMKYMQEQLDSEASPYIWLEKNE